jgi:hypothetical protein
MISMERLTRCVLHIELGIPATEHKEEPLRDPNKIVEAGGWGIFSKRLRILVEEIVIPPLDGQQAAGTIAGTEPS